MSNVITYRQWDGLMAVFKSYRDLAFSSYAMARKHRVLSWIARAEYSKKC